MLKNTTAKGTSEMTKSEQVNKDSRNYQDIIHVARMNATLTGRTFYIFASDRNEFSAMDSGEFKGCMVSGIVAKVYNDGSVR